MLMERHSGRCHSGMECGESGPPPSAWSDTPSNFGYLLRPLGFSCVVDGKTKIQTAAMYSALIYPFTTVVPIW